MRKKERERDTETENERMFNNTPELTIGSQRKVGKEKERER